MTLGAAVLLAAQQARAGHGSRYVFDLGNGPEVWDFLPPRGHAYTRVDPGGVITIGQHGEPEQRVGKVDLAGHATLEQRPKVVRAA